VENQFTRGLAVEGVKKLSELLVNFFQLPDRTAELSKGVIKGAGRWVISLNHHLIIVIVIINDKRGHGAGCAGVCKGVGGRVLEFEVKSLPF